MTRSIVVAAGSNASGPLEVPGAVSMQQVAEARQELGVLLARCREMAGPRQKDLADRLHYVRSTIAGVETGRQATPRQFWERADAELDADGVLVKAFDQVEDLLADHRRQRHAARRQARYAALRAELRRYADLLPLETCPYGCPPHTPVVDAWTGRHIRALCQAARLDVPELASALDETPATISSWLRRARPLTATAQRRLDAWLATADPAVRSRFSQLLDRTSPIVDNANAGQPLAARDAGR